MLLGFDFMYKHAAQLDMENYSVTLGSDTIPMQLGTNTVAPKVAKVIVSKRKVIPPNSVARVKCKLSDMLPDYIVEATNESKLMIPRTAHLARQSQLYAW